MTILPFAMYVPDPATLDADSGDDGASLAFTRRLVDHWLDRFDRFDRRKRG